MSVRRMSVMASGACALVLAVASVAWACSGNPWISAPKSCAPGETVNVSGRWFTGPTELHWDRADGPQIGGFAAGFAGFEAPVKIPAASPGTHAIVAVQYDAGTGELVHERSTACQVPVPGRANPELSQATSSILDADAPGLLDPAPRPGLGLGSAAGVGVATIGAALMAAAAVAEVRRRRVPVPVHHGRAD